jgi:glycosyltransferase involved in cell wall biosynthesis
MTLGGFSPSVSVITPTFNQARFIGACMSSVVAQTYPNWDQFILDDGSTDDTADVVRRQADPRIRYEHQPHLGILALPETYNRALRATTGELVAILEGDDFWAPDKLELLVPKFRDPEVVLAYGRTAIVVGGSPSGKSIPDASFTKTFGTRALFNRPVGSAALALLQTGFPFTFPCSVVVRRSTLEAIGGFQAVTDLGAVDYPTFLTLTLRGRFEYVDRIVAYWRRHAASGSWPGHQRDMVAAHTFARSFMRAHAADLRLSPDQERRIERTWQRRLERASFNTGRYLLLQRRWADARDSFNRALLSTYPPVFIGGFVGYAASLLRADIEGLLAATGRMSFTGEPTAQSHREGAP